MRIWKGVFWGSFWMNSLHNFPQNTSIGSHGTPSRCFPIGFSLISHTIVRNSRPGIVSHFSEDGLWNFFVRGGLTHFGKFSAIFSPISELLFFTLFHLTTPRIAVEDFNHWDINWKDTFPHKKATFLHRKRALWQLERDWNFCSKDFCFGLFDSRWRFRCCHDFACPKAAEWRWGRCGTRGIYGMR